ncbi:MAG TPA: EAL domain-containing protein [Acidimicrobiales bacterium]|nr:EAL domain-containing protein [Acidimicrobiales bacterium]
MEGASPWSAQQLVEFLTAVSVYTTEPAALRGAVERVSEAFEAEAAAVVAGGSVAASVGFPAGRTPRSALIDAVASQQPTFDVLGVGVCHLLLAAVDIEGDGHLILARSDPPFAREEVSLLRAMARVVSLTVRNLRVLASLRERQTLVERLSQIERLISIRAPLPDVLDGIGRGCLEILEADVARVYVVDSQDTTKLSPAATAGEEPPPSMPQHLVGRGAVGRSVADDDLIVIEDYETWPEALPSVVDWGLQSVMAAPIHEHGTVVGSLVVGSRSAGRSFTASEQDVVTSFAEHASLAITDSRTVSALHEAVDDALHKALHDPLTGLPNRARFLDRLDHALAVRHGPGIEVAVLYVDLDDFKMINDRFGHAAGDRLLVEVAQRLGQAVRVGDTVARLGGDEFAVLLENTAGLSDAQRAASRIFEALHRPFWHGGNDLASDASIGIALTGFGMASDELLRNADVAMYRAKGTGKGCAVVFEPGMYQSLLDRIELEAELRNAVERHEIDVHFQPIVDLATEKVVAVEALARWSHPTRGSVPPATFIPVAEELGLIVALGRQVLGRACTWMGGWQRRHPDDRALSLSVNISARQLKDPRLATDVAQALMTSLLPPSSLVLEITESVLMQDADGCLPRLRELKDLGIRLAFDDFGTGYSSLSYLRRFPVDLLKIDRSFVSALGTGGDVPLIVQAIIALGDALGLETVAEGLERPDELALLRTVGCRFGQGYYFAKPMSADELERYLAGGTQESMSVTKSGSSPTIRH